MKKDSIVLVLTLVLIVFFDQLFKSAFTGSEPNVFSFGPFHLEFFANYGISLGNLANTNPIIRVVVISTFYGFLGLFYFGAVFYFWNSREIFLLRFGLTLFFGGISGNALDRISYGYVIDYFEVRLGFLNGLVFNFADVILLLAIVISNFSVFYLNKKIWYLNNLRKFKIINSRFQYALSIKLFIIGLLINFITGAFGYSLLVALIPKGDILNEAKLVFILGTVSIAIVLSFLLFIFGLVLSHRVSGPIYALSKYVDDLANDHKREFRIRSNDYHQEVLEIGKKVFKIYDKK